MNADPKTQPQQFVGGLIGGAVLKKVLEVALDKAMTRIEKSPSIPVDVQHKAPIKEVVTKEVLKEIGPIMENLSNQEPLWRSKILWASLGAFAMSIANMIDMYSNGSPDTATNYVLAASAAIGSLGAIYSRVFPGKALGR